MKIYLKNATYIDWKSLEFTKTSIEVTEGVDGGIRFIEQIPVNEASKAIDCSGKLVTKSFACGHHHVYSALARGMGAPKKIPVNFHEILQYVWWTLDKSLDKDMVEASAFATAIACAKNGVTFVIDHHASPNFIKGSLDIIGRAFEKTGLSHLLCYEITDRDGKEKAEAGLEESEVYLKNNQGLVGLHASFTVGKETLKKAVELSKKTSSGIHIHVAEDLYDQKQCVVEHGQSVVERLHNAGVLDFSKSILGHCLHLENHERELICDSKAWVVQNAESNMNNNVGYFNGKDLGERIMMGTDGMHSDMLRSAKSAFFVGQNFDTIDYPSSYTRFRNVHNYLSQNGFKGDGSNNLVVLDYDSPTNINSSNFLGHFIFGLESKHVRDVISNGRLIVKDGKLLTINEKEVFEFARIQADRLWKKMQGGN